MRMMLGLIRPDTGSIRIKGETFSQSGKHLLRHVGAIIERPDMYGYLSGMDNLRIFARLSGIKVERSHLEGLLELVSLTGRGKDKVKGYSQGMKQRLGIAIALVHNPDILVLDEPTNGLDPQGIADMRGLIMRLSHERGKTILISSHLLHEVELMANRMLIIHNGRRIAEGAVDQLLHPEDTLMEIRMEAHVTIADELRASDEWKMLLQEAETDRLLFKMNPDRAPELLRWLIAHGTAVRSMQARHSLEAYFLSLTNHAAAAH